MWYVTCTSVDKTGGSCLNFMKKYRFIATHSEIISSLRKLPACTGTFQHIFIAWKFCKISLISHYTQQKMSSIFNNVYYTIQVKLAWSRFILFNHLKPNLWLKNMHKLTHVALFKYADAECRKKSLYIKHWFINTVLSLRNFLCSLKYKSNALNEALTKMIIMYRMLITRPFKMFTILHLIKPVVSCYSWRTALNNIKRIMFEYCLVRKKGNYSSFNAHITSLEDTLSRTRIWRSNLPSSTSNKRELASRQQMALSSLAEGGGTPKKRKKKKTHDSLLKYRYKKTTPTILIVIR